MHSDCRILLFNGDVFMKTAKRLPRVHHQIMLNAGLQIYQQCGDFNLANEAMRLIYAEFVQRGMTS